MNGYAIAYLCLMGLSALSGLYCLSRGNEQVPIKRETYGRAGFDRLLGVLVSVPLFLAAIGVIG